MMVWDCMRKTGLNGFIKKECVQTCISIDWEFARLLLMSTSTGDFMEEVSWYIGS